MAPREARWAGQLPPLLLVLVCIILTHGNGMGFFLDEDDQGQVVRMAVEEDQPDQVVGTALGQDQPDQVVGMALARDQPDRVVGMSLNLDGGKQMDTVEGHFVFPQELNATTICLWLKPYHWYESNVVLRSEHFGLYLHRGNISVGGVGGYYAIFDAVVDLRLWSHVCYILDSEGVRIFRDARPAKHLLTLRDNGDSSFHLPSGNTSVSCSVKSLIFSYSGYIADPQMFPVALTQEEVEDVRAGGVTPDGGEGGGGGGRRRLRRPLQGTRLVIDEVVATPAANDSNENHEGVLTSFSYRELLLQPREDETVLTFVEEVTYLQASQLCHSYGGTLPDRRVHNESTILLQCGYRLGSGHEIWLISPSLNRMSVSDCEDCLLMSIGGKRRNSILRWPCKMISYAVCCFVPNHQFVRLKGDNVGDERDFLIVHETKYPKSLKLEGTGTLRVVWNGSRAEIQTTSGKVLYWKVSTGQHFMGRDTWISSNRERVTLSLSTCSAKEYTCDNGQCIPLRKRCDTLPGDCDDFSDDDATCWQFLGPSQHYISQKTPADPLVNVSLRMKFVREVDINNDKLQMIVNVDMSWRDDRLVFHNLRNGSQQPNSFDDENLSSLWHPVLFFPGALFEENLNIAIGERINTSAELIPERDGTPTEVESYEALEYLGRDVIIKVRQSVVISSYCRFDLTAFPFDVQWCLVPVRLEGSGPPQIDTQHLVVGGGDHVSQVFWVLPIRYFFNTSTPVVQEVTMAVLLVRRSEAFLLSMVGPCMVLCLLGHISFVAFTVDQFSERASTSLSLLIVVASLFSQAVSNLPETASPKAIDVWFFYFILRFFLFFVFHWLVELQRRRVVASAAAALKKVDGTTVQETPPALNSSSVPPYALVTGTGDPDSGGIKARVHPEESYPSSEMEQEPQRKAVAPAPPRQQGWILEASVAAKPATLLLKSPDRVNRASIIFGVLLDTMFLVGFYCHVSFRNSNIVRQFNSYHNCTKD